MGLMTKAFVMMAMVACLTSVAHGIAGQATYYTPPYRPSACFGDEDRGVMILVANSVMFDNRTACGTRYRVTCTARTYDGDLKTCTGNSIDVTVIDGCPECVTNQIDLPIEAFTVLANITGTGRINIEYNRI